MKKIPPEKIRAGGLGEVVVKVEGMELEEAAGVEAAEKGEAGDAQRATKI